MRRLRRRGSEYKWIEKEGMKEEEEERGFSERGSQKEIGAKRGGRRK